jgi:hypothetical protein
MLRPNGTPCIVVGHYHSGAHRFHAAFFYPLSAEVDEEAPRMGEVEDFTMDSLRNQIILEPMPITGNELEEFNEDFKDYFTENYDSDSD